MQAAQILAGYSLGDADLLRRAMGKKIKAEMDAQRERFVEGCAEVSADPRRKANELFDLIDKFAGYGFNKSHAAAYALLAYQTAWLKTHGVPATNSMPPRCASTCTSRTSWRSRSGRRTGRSFVDDMRSTAAIPKAARLR
jgi:hypothetical protein